MFLSRLTLDVRSREFRRDYADVHQMHRTMMSAFPSMVDTDSFRAEHAVLWRIDTSHNGLTCYVQSHTEPDWSTLPAGYLQRPAETRSLQPVLDAAQAGRMFSFLLVANPTRFVRPVDSSGQRGKGKRVPHRKPEQQIEWIVRKGDEHGFVIPTAMNGSPNVSPSPCPTISGRKNDHGKRSRITIEPVRFHGHLIITDPSAFTSALKQGIGRAKSYGCGLISLAPARKRNNS